MIKQGLCHDNTVLIDLIVIIPSGREEFLLYLIFKNENGKNLGKITFNWVTLY